MGLQKVVDLGAWWKETTGLPLPLGGNCIRRAMGQEAMTEVTAILKQSIEFGLSQRKAALAHAGRFARDLPPHLTDQFVGMYVNRWTLDYGDTGRQAIVELLRRGHQVGMVPDLEQIDFVG
jgi:1,4-dihydroxy-6-naphthoate synthase